MLSIFSIRILEMLEVKKYIEELEGGLVLCSNPIVDGGISAMTVNVNISPEAKLAFKDSIKRMVLSKLLSPKFAEVILAAVEMKTVKLIDKKIA
jgi:hypothetical protein